MPILYFLISFCFLHLFWLKHCPYIPCGHFDFIFLFGFATVFSSVIPCAHLYSASCGFPFLLLLIFIRFPLLCYFNCHLLQCLVPYSVCYRSLIRKNISGKKIKTNRTIQSQRCSWNLETKKNICKKFKKLWTKQILMYKMTPK